MSLKADVEVDENADYDPMATPEEDALAAQVTDSHAAEGRTVNWEKIKASNLSLRKSEYDRVPDTLHDGKFTQCYGLDMYNQNVSLR